MVPIQNCEYITVGVEGGVRNSGPMHPSSIAAGGYVYNATLKNLTLESILTSIKLNCRSYPGLNVLGNKV